MPEVLSEVWSRPHVRINAARRSVIQALEMLTDDTMPGSVVPILEPLRIVSSLLASIEEEMRDTRRYE